ncbi:hypothetical protein BGX33_009780 [Mortierella sp. NVP41]|nr:hypothetical protein BGX33_009780 [Mortierella sp. NVP41]
MRPTPKPIVKEAIRLMSEGVSTRGTAQQLNISPSMARKIYSSNREKMPTATNKGGRPRTIKAETVEYLKINMKRKRIRITPEARDKANELLPAPVSTTTIRRRLKEAGLTLGKENKKQAPKQQQQKE